MGEVKHYLPVPIYLFIYFSSEKKIIWPDDQSLSIEQSVKRIEKDSGLDKHKILSHIIGWLQMEYVPEGLDEIQMEQFENKIDSWIKKYGSKLP